MITIPLKRESITNEPKYTDAIRFIGSKAHLLPFIEKIVMEQCGDNHGSFGDLFCGTATVSSHFKKLGYRVIANDNLSFCAMFAKAALLVNSEPKFTSLVESSEIPTSVIDRLMPSTYDFVLAYLNRLPGIKSFIFEEYSPGGVSNRIFQRKYFSNENAQRIDAVREKIAEWEKNGVLAEEEKALLITNLMRAANKVANIAGTYGYFMKDWDPRAFKAMNLTRSTIVRSNKKHEVYQEDANSLIDRIKCKILYLDPPYTWRHYGAYYHILETISKWDHPKVGGRSGLRPWEEYKSRYCYRYQAADALAELIEKSRAEHIFLSYNSEGLIPHDEILKILSGRGDPTVYEVEYRRYKSNSSGSSQVMERLYYVNTS